MITGNQQGSTHYLYAAVDYATVRRRHGGNFGGAKTAACGAGHCPGRLLRPAVRHHKVAQQWLGHRAGVRLDCFHGLYARAHRQSLPRPAQRRANRDDGHSQQRSDFLGLSVYALSTKKDLSFMGGFLMVGILLAFLIGLSAIFFEIPALALTMSAALVLLMSGLILYKTSNIIHGGETN